MNELRILVTGDRYWNQPFIIKRELENVAYMRMPPYDVIKVIQGGANGADALARKIAEEQGWQSITVEAEWDKYGLAAGPIRNQRMIDEYKPDICLAFHTDLSKSKGTLDCIKRANRVGIPIHLFSK